MAKSTNIRLRAGHHKIRQLDQKQLVRVRAKFIGDQQQSIQKAAHLVHKDIGGLPNQRIYVGLKVGRAGKNDIPITLIYVSHLHWKNAMSCWRGCHCS